jgi:hypothetical protein
MPGLPRKAFSEPLRHVILQNGNGPERANGAVSFW